MKKILSDIGKNREKKIIGANAFFSMCLVLFFLIFTLPFLAGAKNYQFKKNKKEIVEENLNKIKIDNKKKEKQKVKIVPGEILVKFKEKKINLKKFSDQKNKKKKDFIGSEEEQKIKNLEKKFGLKKKDLMAQENTSLMKITDEEALGEKMQKIKKSVEVESVQPNFKYFPADINPADDSDYGEQWGLNNTGQTINADSLYHNSSGTADADVDAPEAWAISDGGADSIIAAILDTGVAYSHPDLNSSMWDGSSCVNENGVPIVGGCIHGYDYDDNDNDPAPDDDSLDSGSFSHGTHIAGIVAGADDAQGIVGLAPKTKIMAIKAADLTTSELIKGIAFAEQNGAKIINASWGGTGDQGVEDALLKSAIKNFDGLFIAAAGNDGDNIDLDPYMPCYFKNDPLVTNLICVAATSKNDGLAGWSNYGENLVSVGAPGEDIYSTIGETKNAEEYFDGDANGSVPSGFTEDGNWQIQPAPDALDWMTGDKVLFADTSLPYSDSLNTIFGNTNNYNMSGATTAHMSFYVACDTENDGNPGVWKDYLALEMSSNGTDFTEIDRWDEENIDNDDSGGWKIDIFNSYINPTYLTANFKFRFRWVTDGANNNYGGCIVDELKIKTYKNSVDNGYDYYDGTSMATPFVVGLAGLIWGTEETLSIAQVKNLLLRSGDSLPALNYKTETGRRINAYKAITSKRIDSFEFSSLGVDGTINEGAKTISFELPYGTNISSLAPTISFTGVSVSPSSGTAQNFSSPVTYRMTALDGTTVDYIVTVNVAAELEKKINLFQFGSLNPAVSASINESNRTIEATLPYGVDRTALAPTISFVGASINPASGVAQNFSSPVTYTITDANGVTKNYTVTISLAKNSAKRILSFNIDHLRKQIVGNIDENNKTIKLTVPNGTNISSLVPNINIEGVSINPTSNVAQDFSSSKIYTVTAEDGTTASYGVTVEITGEAYISRIQKSGKKKTIITIQNLNVSKSKKYKPTTGFLNGRRVRISKSRISGNRTILTINWPYKKWPRGSYSFSFNYKVPVSKKAYIVRNFTTAGNDFWL